MKLKEKKSVFKKPKNLYRHGDLKNVLISLAIKLIDEKNEVSFTIREIAALAGVTHTAAYRHFQSKKEILETIAVMGFSKMQSDFEMALVEASKNKTTDFVLLGVAYINFAIENPTLFRVMFHHELKDCDQNEILKAAGPSAYQTLVTVIESNLKKGKYQNNNIDEMSLTAWSLVHGAATLYINGMLDQEDKLSKEQMKQHALQICNNLESGFLKR